MKACRDGFGKAIIALGRRKDVIAMSADLSPSVRLDEFKKTYPKQYFDTGVAEQNLAAVASGMAHMGKTVFIAGFGAFLPGMCYQQIRTTIAYNNVPVHIVASHCGLNVGEDGATHQMLEDVGMMRSLPGMIVVAPADAKQAKEATLALAKEKSPTYMRFGRSKTPDITNGFTLGKAEVLRRGSDIAIIGYGEVLAEALAAAKESDLSVEVVNMHTLSPLDTRTIKRVAKKCKAIITVEDHHIDGGIGSAVCETLAGENIPIERMGVRTFGESGNYKELYAKYGLDKKSIEKTISAVAKQHLKRS